MEKPWSCGAVLLVGLVIVALLGLFGYFPASEQNSANTIIAAHNACEAQTGKRCD